MPPASSARRAALALLLTLPAWALAAKPRKTGPSYARHPAAEAFAAEVAARHNLPKAWILAQLAQARRLDAVRQLIMPPAAGSPKNWAAYRARFIEPRRIGAGLSFWRDNETWLDAAHQRWGVPPQIVVGIIGVETFYGRITGSLRVIDSLATLAFDFPTGRSDRSAFFRTELEEFLVMCRRERIDPLGIKGSYAGAMGLAQFMPSSVNRHAVDMDDDGHIDLHRSAADAIGSVAHYLAQFGWQRDLPTHFEVTPPPHGAERTTLLGPDIVPTFSAADLVEHGAVLGEGARAHAGPLALVELQNGDAEPSHIAGTQNFYTLTRYNWSSYYALAVIELGEAVQRARQ